MNELENQNNPEPVSPETPDTPVVTPETEVAAPATPEVHPEVVTSETVPVPTEPVVEETIDNEASTQASGLSKRTKYIIASLVAVGVLLVGLLYVMERNGQVHTGLFAGIERMRTAGNAVATVNGAKISEYDLNISIEQITVGAKAQGVDTSDAQVQEDIKAQAIEMLVNTELLKQEAANRGIEITQEDVDTRYASLVEEVGGVEVLQERMTEFNVNEKVLLKDIRNELTIQRLLDEVFATETIAVSEEEVVEMYTSAGGEAAGLPPLAELREQIEQQITTTKEQTIVNSFVAELREKATVEISV